MDVVKRWAPPGSETELRGAVSSFLGDRAARRNGRARTRVLRWLPWAAATNVALAVVWAVPAADWLAHHDVSSVTGSLHETALDNARDRLLTLGAGLFAAGALWFTAQNFVLSREGQVTDRYTKAIEQLAPDDVQGD